MARALTLLEQAVVARGWTQTVHDLVSTVAGVDGVVLIRGEQGTGKDFLARAIHSASSRRDRPFVKVACRRIPPELADTELFGCVKGAFRGAERRRPGRVEFGHRGTLFLEDIEALWPHSAKLVGFLRTLAFSRVGNDDVRHVDTRIVASSACSSPDTLSDFAVIELHLPALRERKDEIPALASHFLARFNELYGLRTRLSPETLAVLTQYAWPGNVRELERVIWRLVTCGDVGLTPETRGRQPSS